MEGSECLHAEVYVCVHVCVWKRVPVLCLSVKVEGLGTGWVQL